MTDSSPINELELQHFAMELNATAHQDKKLLMATQVLEGIIRQAASAVGATNSAILYSPVVCDLVMTAQEAAPKSEGRTEMITTVGFLLAAALRCASGATQMMQKRVDLSGDPDDPITI